MNKHSSRYLPSAYILYVWFFHQPIRSDCFHFLHYFPNPTIYKLPAANFNDSFCRCTEPNSCGKIPQWRSCVMVEQREKTRQLFARTVSRLFYLAEFGPVLSCSTVQACIINMLHWYSVTVCLDSFFFSLSAFVFFFFLCVLMQLPENTVALPSS